MRPPNTRMPHRARRAAAIVTAVVVLVPVLLLAACAPPELEPPNRGPGLPQDAFSPDLWKDAFPQEYKDWAATADERPARSRYKKGGEPGTYDKLSEYPFLSAMAKGIGFSVEFNEPRGHALALKDQNEIDPARLKAGGVCLACKSPYYDTLHEQQGDKLLSMPYDDAVNLIPEKDRELGVSCRDCHEPKGNAITYTEYMSDALGRIGADVPNENQLRNVVCGQCHSTYTIAKEDGKAVALFAPWNGGSYGDIAVEDIIETMESDPRNLEWTQGLTGLKLGYIRHPEFELYTKRGVHYSNGVTCVDCHQPYKIAGGSKVSDHNVMSPLDAGMKACMPCHPGRSEDQLREDVFHIQDNYIGALLNAGYATVANAQLIRLANESRVPTTGAESAAWGQAIDMYKQAFYRVAYSAGENSVGFHNPPEANRVLQDALAYSMRADQILREILARHGVTAPSEVDLQLLTYLEDRGERQLDFRPEQEFRDPRGVAEILWKTNLKALRSGAGSTEQTASP